jgi:hypothetical protein
VNGLSLRALAQSSQRKVEPEFALDPRDKFVVALGGLRNHLLVRLARPPFKRRRCVGPGGVAKLPAVAIDDVADQVADNRRRGLIGEPCGEEGRDPPGMGIGTTRWNRIPFLSESAWQ